MLHPVAGVLMLWAAGVADSPPPLPVVPNLEPEKFYGRYYEVGTYLQWMQRGCSNTQMSFERGEVPDTARVTAECKRGLIHQKIHGVAVPLDPAEPARTEVRFKIPFGGEFKEEFHIILAAEDYGWVVIGNPNRQLLWVLSRDPAMPTQTLNGLLQSVEDDFAYPDVRQHFTCTRHKKIDPRLCKDAVDNRTLLRDVMSHTLR